MADQGGSPSNRSTTAKGLKVRKTKTKNPPEQTGAQGGIRLIREVMNPALKFKD
jgi:hypothetical protein